MKLLCRLPSLSAARWRSFGRTAGCFESRLGACAMRTDLLLCCTAPESGWLALGSMLG